MEEREGSKAKVIPIREVTYEQTSNIFVIIPLDFLSYFF